MIMIGSLRALAILAALTIASETPRAAPPPDTRIVASIGSNTLPMDVSGTRVLLPFESNRPIDRAAAVTRLVVYIHGSHRQVKLSQAVVASLGVSDRSDTLLFQPQFLKDRDRAPHHLPANMLTWAAHWEWGDLSLDAPRISSFEITDRVILDLLTRFPSIRDVVVVGNSAGGQFVQRYAALSAAEDKVNAGGARIRFIYVASNPSSYLYFDGTRADASGHMRVPTSAEVAGCPEYNEYGYGLDRPNAYAKQTGPADIATRFLRRSVVYFIGDDDNDENHPDLDKRCAAEMQGPERFQRSRNYWNHLMTRFGAAALERQLRFCVPRGTHNSRTIWDSACARFYISGTGACQPSRCPD
jgi:pimeloyl-ACP methyl ester carboxylesterase